MERLAAMFFCGRRIWAVFLQEGDKRIVYVIRIAVNRCFSAAADLKKAIPSRTARDYRMSGVNGCQEASWSEASAERRAIWSQNDPRFLDIVCMANPSVFINYKCGMPILKGRCSSTNIRFRTFASRNSRLELALAASVVLSGRVVADNSYS